MRMVYDPSEFISRFNSDLGQFFHRKMHQLWLAYEIYVGNTSILLNTIEMNEVVA